jgi:flavodoxin
MNIAVRYHSRGGNTKKVADAIADAVSANAEDCSVPITEPVDLLFLGGSVYGFGLDDATKDFISGLDASQVKSVALFGTSAIVKNGNREMAKLLETKGISALIRDFYCRGEFTVMHRGRPNADDLKQAAEFAKATATAL